MNGGFAARQTVILQDIRLNVSKQKHCLREDLLLIAANQINLLPVQYCK